MTYSQQIIILSGLAALSYVSLIILMEKWQSADYRHILATIYAWFLAGGLVTGHHLATHTDTLDIPTSLFWLTAGVFGLLISMAVLQLVRRYQLGAMYLGHPYLLAWIASPLVVAAGLILLPLPFGLTMKIVGVLLLGTSIYAFRHKMENQAHGSALTMILLSSLMIAGGFMASYFGDGWFFVMVFGAINAITLMVFGYMLERRWVESQDRIVEHERTVGTLSLTMDELAKLKNLHESTKSILANGYWEYAPETDVLHVSEEMAQNLGMEVTEITEAYERWLDHIVPEYRDPVKNPIVHWIANPGDFLEELNAVPGLDYMVSEFQYRTRTKGVKWIRARVSYNQDVKRFIGTLELIQEYMETQQRLETLKYYDSLTGLPNKKRFFEDVEELLGTDQDHVVFILDVDHFQRVNDTIGHDAGDLMLRRIGGYLTDHHLQCYRLGGDEFVAVVPSQDAEEILNNLISEEAPASFSIGATLLKEKMSASEALRQSDLALFHAKKKGRRRAVWYQTDFDRALRKRIEYEYMLESTQLENQLDVAFQPKVRLNDLEVIEVEALIRWRVGKGYVSPGEFLPVAEENGSIHRIGRYVLTRALEWLKENPKGPRISVNVSAKQLEDDVFVNWMIKELGRMDIDASRLTIELTETVLVNSFSQSQQLFKKMKEAGIRIALDDFGTGYSSLSYLLQLPIDELKLDKSFIDLISQSDRSLQLVSGIQSMVDGMGIELVVEGVETAEQAQILKKLQISYIQGYWFSKPLFVNELNDLLQPNPVAFGYEVTS